MSLDILTNISSLQSQNYLNSNVAFQAQTINEVTSGMRIVNAGDDAAGLAVANTYRSDEAVLSQGIRNANDGLATLQTIDGGMSNISELLDRASTLAAQSASQAFQGDRTVLNNEFQNVLTEINRQAQSIGMTAGGTFAQNIQVYIGGGRSDAASPTAADAITNGSVDVNLSNSLLDTTSLGLSSNGVLGVNVQSGSGNLASALAAPAGTAKLDFSGANFGPVTVDFSTNFDNTHILTENDLVTAINAAISTAGSANANFAAAGIRAGIDPTTGDLSFTSSHAFAVVDHTATATDAGAILLGDTAVHDVAASGISQATVAGVSLGTQTATFAWVDSTGAAHSEAVALPTASNLTQAAVVATINADTTLQNAGIFAVVKTGKVDFLKSDGGAFQLSVSYNATGAGGILATGGTNGTSTYSSSTTSLAGSAAIDILNSVDATSAVTALQTAVTNLGEIQGTVGRAENQLGYAINLAQSQNTNLSASEAQIRDADMAAEAANLTKAQILVQAGTAALAQANSAPQAVLTLLKT
jgi:flagellin